MAKRDRSKYIRGGLGVRKKLSEESLRDTYRLNGVRTGFGVARCLDRYGRWELGFTVGVVVRKTASIVQVRWAETMDEIHTYDQGDARYEVDRGRWRVLGALQPDPLNPADPIAAALTKLRSEGKMPLCDSVESANESFQTPSSSDDPMADSEPSANRAKQNTTETGGRTEGATRREKLELSSRSMGSPQNSSSECGDDKGNDVPSVDAPASPSSTIATQRENTEPSSVTGATRGSGSSKTMQKRSKPPRRISGSSPLTGNNKSGIMPIAADQGDTPPTEEHDMAEKMSKAAEERAAAKKALTNGELKERETYTAKQVAARCGTDSKTMRKFFRSSASTVEPVGQGGRYEFDAADLPKIKSEFATWRKKAVSRQTKPKPEPIDPAQVHEVLSNHDDPDITMGQLADAIERAQDEMIEADSLYGEDPGDPTEEDLAELEAEDLDLDDLELDD